HAGHLLAQSPELVGRRRVDRPRAHPRHGLVVVGQQGRDIAVFAIDAAFAVELGVGRAPYASGRALTWGFETLVDLAVLVDPAARALLFNGHVTLQIGKYAAWMHSECAYAMLLAAFVEADGEKRICALGAPVGDPFVILALGETRIVQTYGGDAMAYR